MLLDAQAWFYIVVFGNMSELNTRETDVAFSALP